MFRIEYSVYIETIICNEMYKLQSIIGKITKMYQSVIWHMDIQEVLFRHELTRFTLQMICNFCSGIQFYLKLF